MIFTLTANGSTETFDRHDGIVYLQLAYASGTGTLTLETQLQNGTWQAVESGTFTSGPITRRLEVYPRSPLRLTLTNAAGVSITGYLQ